MTVTVHTHLHVKYTQTIFSVMQVRTPCLCSITRSSANPLIVEINNVQITCSFWDSAPGPDERHTITSRKERQEQYQLKTLGEISILPSTPIISPSHMYICKKETLKFLYTTHAMLIRSPNCINCNSRACNPFLCFSIFSTVVQYLE